MTYFFPFFVCAFAVFSYVNELISVKFLHAKETLRQANAGCIFLFSLFL